MASTLVSGVLTGRVPACEVKAGDEWRALRVLRPSRAGWVRLVRVHRSDARDLYGRPYPWREVGEPKAERLPRDGVFVLPQVEEVSLGE